MLAAVAAGAREGRVVGPGVDDDTDSLRRSAHVDEHVVGAKTLKERSPEGGGESTSSQGWPAQVPRIREGEHGEREICDRRLHVMRQCRATEDQGEEEGL